MKLVCIGDSLTHGYKIKSDEAWPFLLNEKLGMEVVNKGIVGDTSSGVLGRFLKDVVEEKASHVIILAGSNDIILDVPLNVIKSHITALVHQSYHYSIRPIVGIPIPICTMLARKYWPFINDFNRINEGISEYRQWLMDFGLNFKCKVIDFYSCFYDFASNQEITRLYSDGLHPTPEGNRIMAESVRV